MKKRIYTRLAAGLLCWALLLTDAASLNVWAISNDPNTEQIVSVEEIDEEEENTESAVTEETDEEEAENPNQELEGDDTPVIEDDDETALPVEEEQESVSENAVEEEPDGISVMSASEEEPIASGKSNDISWVIDVNGKLTVTGNGDWNREDSKYAPWYNYEESIKTAEINATGMTDASYMFYHCENLTAIDLTKFGTSKVTDMQLMFSGCENLTSLNLRNFNTGNVTDMSGMFAGCLNLTALDIGSFETGSVTDMGGMFHNCWNLTTLDVSNFKTDNVTDMSLMFYTCHNLTTLDVNNFNTDSVTDMSAMFDGCRNLTTLNLSNFNTSNVTNMQQMFSNCENLTTLNLSNFDTSSVTDMGAMFYCCVGLTTLNLSNFDTSSVTNMACMFENCGNLTTLDLSNFDTSSVTDMRYMFYVYAYSNLVSLDISNFNTSSVTDMSYMFNGCHNLITLDLSNFNTSNVTNMSYMFEGCSNLTTLDVSSFDTSNVTDMSSIFSHCENLTTLNLNSFNIGNVTNMKSMFNECSDLTTIYTPRNVKQSVELPSGVWYCDDTEVSELPQNLAYSVTLRKHWIANSTSRDVSWMIDANGKLTVSGTGDFERNDGRFAPWYNYHDSIKTAEFTVTDMTDASYMLFGCSNLTSIDLKNFDTRTVADMSGMFWGCSNLTTLDLSHFNTDKVTDMSDMFMSCHNLTTLDLSRFYTSKVTDMCGMFSGCHNLTTLDVSNFNTGKVTEMGLMFSGCSSLTMLDVSSFDTHNVTDMGAMFSGCHNLTTLDVSNFNTDKVTEMELMFSGCSSLTMLDVSSFDTSNVTDMGAMFSGCNNLSKLDLSSFNTRSVTIMGGMFELCQNLTTLDVSSFDTSNVTHMNVMFYGCNNLSTLDVSSFNTSNVTEIEGMFDGCSNLTTLDLRHFNTDNVTYMYAMFNGCNSLTELNLSSFNTCNVWDMGAMFSGCNNLSKLDLSSFDTSNVTEIEGMFDGCSNLTTIYTPRNVKQYVTLPAEPGDKWYRSDDSSEVTELPRDLDKSVVLGKNYIPKDKEPNIPPEDPDNPDDGVLPQDIPDDGVIPQGLWISRIADQTYTGAKIEPEVRVYDGKKRLKQGTDYTLSYQNTTKAAQANDVKPPTVVVKSKGNYAGTETKPFTIAKRDVSDIDVTKTFTDAYTPLTNGKNPKLAFSAKYNNKALKEKTDYTLTVKNNVGNEVTSYGAVGTYTAVVKGVGNYMGEYSFSFEVLNKVPVSKLKIGKIATVNYDGTSKTPEPVIKYGKVTLIKGTDYTLSYLNNTEIGTATIVITGIGDYFGTRNVTFSIAGLPIKQAKVTGFIKSIPYTGAKVYQSEAVLKYGENDLVQGTDYTVSYSNNLNKGKATLTYTGIGKYTGTIKKTYSITAYNIKTDAQKRIKLLTDAISVSYAKGGAKPSLKVYDGTRLLTEGKDYTLSYQNNAAVTKSATGKRPTITVKGKGNYAGTFSEKKTFTITAKDIADVTVTAPDMAASTKAGKYKSTPALTDTTGKKLKAGTDYDKTYTYTYKNKTEKVLNNGTEVTRNAGDPVEEKDIVPANTVLCVRVKAKEGSNYTGEKTAEYRIAASLINKAKITVQNPAENNKNLFSYTGQAIRLDKSNLVVKVGKDVLSNDQYEILEDTYKNNVSKGTASVQIRGVENYGGTATVKFKIGTKGFRWVQQLFE